MIWFPLVSLGKIVRNKAPSGNIPARTFFLTDIPGRNQGEPILLHVFLLGANFFPTNSQKISLPMVSLEITVKKNIRAGIFTLGA
jgi:hypothetical protein